MQIVKPKKTIIIEEERSPVAMEEQEEATD